jgi:hypothetical protein
MGTKARRAREATEREIRNTPLSNDERAFLRAHAAYEGSPFHKKEPNNFGLTPPTYPRPDKTLCDEAGITDKAIAFALFARALEVGLVSRAWKDGFPKQIWVVDDGNQVFEVIYGGSTTGRYHGYPVRLRDPLFEQVRAAWGRLSHGAL